MLGYLYVFLNLPPLPSCECRGDGRVTTPSRRHHDVITTPKGGIFKGEISSVLDDFYYFCYCNFICSYRNGDLEFLKMMGMSVMGEGGDTSGFFIRPMNLFSQKALSGNMSRSILTETL